MTTWRLGLLLSCGLMANASAWAAADSRSDLPAARYLKVRGIKWPNSRAEGDKAIVSEASTLGPAFSGVPQAPGRRNTELLPFVTPTPDQEEAGSCLYMSLTGVAEWWLARLNPDVPRTLDGPLDLSERYMMNLAGMDEDKDARVANWKTDSIYLFNQEHRSVRNSSYRFTKGWYTLDDQGNPHAAAKGSAGAVYDTTYNWIDDRASVKSGYVTLPNFDRDILFADPESDQWDVGVAPSNLVARVKDALDNQHAPVHVIYNHYGYWHAVVIVGYDDELPNEGCAFVTKTMDYLLKEPAELRRQAMDSADERERATLLARAGRAEKAGDKLAAAYKSEGGCHGDKGMFYVRDSIYATPSEPIYRYDPTDVAGDGHYSQKIILHEYDWLLYLVNHAVQVRIAP